MDPGQNEELDSAERLPRVWEYTDYRTWLGDHYQARKKLHRWYSYAVLAQKAGFSTRSFLLRVIRGERGLGPDSATKLADALELKGREKEYFLALVDYNQARKDADREVAWSKVQNTLARARNISAPRLLTGAHRQILSSWHHLAVRALVEAKPDRGDWEALGARLRPRRSRTSVQRSIQLLERVGLVERRPDGLWHAVDKSLATPPEVAMPAVRKYHRGCLKLAAASLERFPTSKRHLTGLMLSISHETYAKMCTMVSDFNMQLIRMAEDDLHPEGLYQLSTALFPLTDVAAAEDKS